MAGSSPVILVCFFLTLLQGKVHSECLAHAVETSIPNWSFCLLALDSCEPEGSIQLAVNDPQEYIDSNNQMYHLLQVCLFGHWSYVCSNGFGIGDRRVALYQLGCTQGGR